ncbi:MAG: hypothetical protein SCALA702_19860 [Melioribacteraceae bacterium]|nr:MAG: hypothetical protein SCALA702_19860 [Melioribacteraceae bacterium]
MRIVLLLLVSSLILNAQNATYEFSDDKDVYGLEYNYFSGFEVLENGHLVVPTHDGFRIYDEMGLLHTAQKLGVMSDAVKSLNTVAKKEDGGFIIYNNHKFYFFSRHYVLQESCVAESDLVLIDITTDAEGNIYTLELGRGVHLRKYSADMNLVWNRMLHEYSFIGVTESYLECDYNRVLCGSPHFGDFLFRENGDLIWEKNLNFVDAKFARNSIYGLAGEILYQYSLAGDYIETIAYYMRVYAFDISSAYFVYYSIEMGKIFSIQKSTNYVSESEFMFAYFNGLKIHNNFIYGVGPANYRIKLDYNAACNALFLTLPEPNSKAEPDSEINIEWSHKNIEYVNLFYSTDNKKSWNTIVVNLPADIQEYLWQIPEDAIGKVYLKIESRDGEQLHILDYPLWIGYYNYEDMIESGDLGYLVNADGMGMGLNYPVGGSSFLGWRDGPVWGYVKKDSIKIGGSSQDPALVAGEIFNDGTISNKEDLKYSLYHVSQDWESLTHEDELNEFGYAWNNWPSDIGAPWIDKNHDGVYSPEIDKPDIPGSEAIYWVNNASDDYLAYRFGNCTGEKIELQNFVHNLEGESNLFDLVLFREMKIINKSEELFENMYFSYWTDIDLGNPADDVTGCDSSLNLGYVYNGDDNDDGYYGYKPPAVGYMILDGPAVPGTSSDTAKYRDISIVGMKNLPMTSFMPIIKNHLDFHENIGTPNANFEVYNNLQGLLWDGDKVINPLTNQITKFPLDGNPLSGTGWYDTTSVYPSAPPYDRRFKINSGPFNMAPGDTQRVTIAIIVAHGNNRLHSVQLLLDKAKAIQQYNKYGFERTLSDPYNLIIPEKFELFQNYPNPFNPSTTIKYDLPEDMFVKLELFNILGERIEILVDEQRTKGKHYVRVNGAGLSSGVYIYRIRAGNNTAVKKMVLVK